MRNRREMAIVAVRLAPTVEMGEEVAAEETTGSGERVRLRGMTGEEEEEGMEVVEEGMEEATAGLAVEEAGDQVKVSSSNSQKEPSVDANSIFTQSWFKERDSFSMARYCI